MFKTRLKSIIKELKNHTRLDSEIIINISKIEDSPPPLIKKINQYLEENNKLTHAKYYELIAMANGYPNFDTMSAQINKLTKNKKQITNNQGDNMKNLPRVYKVTKLNTTEGARELIIHSEGSVSLALVVNKIEGLNYTKQYFSDLQMKFKTTDLEYTDDNIIVLITNIRIEETFKMKATSKIKYILNSKKELDSGMRSVEARVRDLHQAVLNFTKTSPFTTVYLSSEEINKFNPSITA